MILDGQNIFSKLDTGDVITVVGATVGDHASTNVIDAGVKGASFSTVSNGGAYVNPFLVARVTTLFTTTTTTGTLQIVLQESTDAAFSSPVDLVASPVYAIGDLVDNAVLLAVRMPQIKERYLRVVYRVAGETLTAGACQVFLTPDVPFVDLQLRGATTTVAMPTGALDQSMPASVTGVLDN